MTKSQKTIANQIKKTKKEFQDNGGETVTRCDSSGISCKIYCSKPQEIAEEVTTTTSKKVTTTTSKGVTTITSKEVTTITPKETNVGDPIPEIMQLSYLGKSAKYNIANNSAENIAVLFEKNIMAEA